MLPTPPPQQPPFRFRTRAPGPTPIPPSMPMPPPTPIPMPGQMSMPGQTTPYGISQQQTMPQPGVSQPGPLSTPGLSSSPVPAAPANSKRKRLGRILAVVLLLGLAVALYLVWNTTASATSPGSSTGISQQNFGSSSTNTGTTNGSSSSSGGTIQVYIVGAVKHPGVYSLPSDARVYQLIQAAGGPLSNANLVALNLAAKVNDGEEVYVTKIGEVPPTYYGGVPGVGTGSGTGTTSTGQLLNINTASSDQMRQQLHVSSTTAQAIINYRQQNGAFTSVDQLQQVVSKTIYDKIKDLVTV